MKKNTWTILITSFGITLITSLGLILNNINYQNYVFRQLENTNLRQVYESIIPFLSGFPFRAYSMCTAEFGKCIWTEYGKLSLIYNFIFWLIFCVAVYFIGKYLNKRKLTVISRFNPYVLTTVILFLVTILFSFAVSLIKREKEDPLLTQAMINGQLSVEQDSQLITNVDKYMESKNNMLCSHIHYGQDDKYVYTWMLCSSYIHNSNGLIEETGGFSVPTRFTYVKGTREITEFKQPGDGSLFDPTLRQLFPYEIYMYGHPDNETIAKLENKNRGRFLEKSALDVSNKLSVFYKSKPEFTNWELQPSFAGKEFAYKIDEGAYYFAFITNGSGVYVVDVKCFKVDSKNNIDEIAKSSISPDTRRIDPKTCKGFTD